VKYLPLYLALGAFFIVTAPGWVAILKALIEGDKKPRENNHQSPRRR
jgi:hypothetical protein